MTAYKTCHEDEDVVISDESDNDYDDVVHVINDNEDMRENDVEGNGYTLFITENIKSLCEVSKICNAPYVARLFLGLLTLLSYVMDVLLLYSKPNADDLWDY